MIPNIIIRFLKKINFYIKLFLSQEKWRKLNSHNFTTIENSFIFDNISIGKHTYGPLIVYRWNSENEKLEIGNFCSIASGVKFILGGNHETNTFSTYPFEYYFNNQKLVATSKGPIIIEDDVWIGTDSIILSGVKIGKGAVIAAGSVVVKDVLPYSIVGGNPAKFIKFRFEEKLVSKVIDFDISIIEDKKITENLNLLNSKLTNNILEELKENLNN